MNSDIESRWKNLAKKLRDTCEKNDPCSKIESNLNYLSKAYLFTEKLWLAQLRNTVPKVVMLSEAPLFGENQNYFYNPDTAPSSFFWFDDAKAVAGDDFARGKSRCGREQKQFLIDTVSNNGLLILDLFPYALNVDTALNYRKIGKELYLMIFRNSLCDHLYKKLDLIKEKCNDSNPPLFLFRYKRLKDRLDHDVKSALYSKNLLEKGVEIMSVGGKNMSLDRQSLTNEIMRAVNYSQRRKESSIVS